MAPSRGRGYPSCRAFGLWALPFGPRATPALGLVLRVFPLLGPASNSVEVPRDSHTVEDKLPSGLGTGHN